MDAPVNSPLCKLYDLLQIRPVFITDNYDFNRPRVIPLRIIPHEQREVHISQSLYNGFHQFIDAEGFAYDARYFGIERVLDVCAV
ncbi:hypothetical protein HM1_1139 [Heliomicrobium modesticaldum Ice1]|uniref:Uncharacterized protein n=1 Tax=Heliobacterium modesticaldum (strain ATCC 51547 / Ice1) TaxID=498761 RepID=B0THJ7_HELMI|nr:hypothetical protein HM1_1139 [Heliomicrobium modesticaldum Ice1]